MEFVLDESELEPLLIKARRLISEVHYITLATTDENGNPWCTPVNVGFDEKLTFYWKSPVDCQHSHNIRTNGRVFFVLFDSRAAVGSGFGVYFKGRASEINEDELDEIQKGSNLIADRVGLIGSLAMRFIKMNPRRVYKAIPEEAWINTVRLLLSHDVDGRARISLEQLCAPKSKRR